MLHLLPGQEKRDGPTGTEQIINGDAKSSFKKQKDAKLKANVGQSHMWNSLFLGANAVADTLATKLNTTKAALLDGEGGTSAGVRMALGETRLVRETRDFLLANNVSLDCFSRPDAKRSDTVIIAKNLPAGVTADELRRMFQRYGEVGRVLLPPGTIFQRPQSKYLFAMGKYYINIQADWDSWALVGVFFTFNSNIDESVNKFILTYLSSPTSI
jgi:multiple RNA-binding domain-containing protein 1